MGKTGADRVIESEEKVTDQEVTPGGETSSTEPKGDAPSSEETGKGDAGKESGKNGFPENTPIAEMTIEQQAAYWKYHSRSNEAKAKKFADGLTKEEAEQLQNELEQLRGEKLSAEEKATEEALEAARQEGANAARDQYLPMLQQAQLQGYAGTVIQGERLSAWVSQADVNAFLDGDGGVDGQKVVDTLVSLFGEKESSKPGQYMDFGQGRGKQPAKSRMEAGLEAARRRGHIKN